MKKIAVIGLKGLPAFGGAAAVGENIIRELKNDYEFTVLSKSTHTNLLTGDYNGVSQIVFNGIDKSAFDTFKYYIKCLLYCLFKGHFDLIYLHHAESGFITPILRIKYKVITTLHMIYFDKQEPKFNRLINKFYRFSEKLNIKFSNIVTSVSKPHSIKCFNYYNRKVYYIPNGIKANNKIEKNVQEYILFAAARIYEIKGLHLLLTALENINYKGKLIILGDLEQKITYKNEIMPRIKNLNAEYHGLITDKNILFKYVANAKLFIFPSLFEAMSMMLMEVGSLLTPIIASNIEENKAIFTDEEVTYFKSNNSDDLAAKIIYCLNNYELLNGKAKKAYDKLYNEYTWDKIALSYKSLFDSLL